MMRPRANSPQASHVEQAGTGGRKFAVWADAFICWRGTYHGTLQAGRDLLVRVVGARVAGVTDPGEALEVTGPSVFTSSGIFAVTPDFGGAWVCIDSRTTDPNVWGAGRELAYAPGASTQARKTSRALEELMERLWHRADDEVFEDGMESALSNELSAIVREYGDNAVLEAHHLIRIARESLDAAAEALRLLGRIQDRATLRSRMWVLAECLKDVSLVVRDGAAIGLASSGQRGAADLLRSAAEGELVPWLRGFMLEAADELEREAPWPS